MSEADPPKPSGTPGTERRYLVDPQTLEMLVCPLTKTRLTLSADRSELISLAGRLAFPIRRGVPMLALDEARSIDPEDYRTKRPINP